MADLHIDYHAVLEAFQRHTTKCPLCATIAEGERAFWESTLYTAIGTEGFQDSFLKGNGLCPHHTREFARHNDGVAITMLYSPLLTHRRRWIDEASRSALAGVFRRRKISPPEAEGRRASREACLLCDRIDRWTTMFALNVLRHQDIAELQRAVASGSGVCVPHYRDLVLASKRKRRRRFGRFPRVSKWFEAFHKSQWDAVVATAEDEALHRGGTAWKSLLRTVEGEFSLYERG